VPRLTPVKVGGAEVETVMTADEMTVFPLSVAFTVRVSAPAEFPALNVVGVPVAELRFPRALLSFQA
jgi:hypothetical protein